MAKEPPTELFLMIFSTLEAGALETSRIEVLAELLLLSCRTCGSFDAVTISLAFRLTDCVRYASMYENRATYV